MNRNFSKAFKYAIKKVEMLGGIFIRMEHYDYDPIDEIITYRFIYRLDGKLEEKYSSYKLKK